jgi:hypothetical protein
MFEAEDAERRSSFCIEGSNTAVVTGNGFDTDDYEDDKDDGDDGDDSGDALAELLAGSANGDGDDNGELSDARDREAFQNKIGTGFLATKFGRVGGPKLRRFWLDCVKGALFWQEPNLDGLTDVKGIHLGTVSDVLKGYQTPIWKKNRHKDPQMENRALSLVGFDSLLPGKSLDLLFKSNKERNEFHRNFRLLLFTKPDGTKVPSGSNVYLHKVDSVMPNTPALSRPTKVPLWCHI